jgi:hypothetical protein
LRIHPHLLGISEGESAVALTLLAYGLEEHRDTGRQLAPAASKTAKESVEDQSKWNGFK